VVESLKVISRDESTRIAKFAFDYATRVRAVVANNTHRHLCVVILGSPLLDALATTLIGVGFDSMDARK
jgi:hypothetical protein